MQNIIIIFIVIFIFIGIIFNLFLIYYDNKLNLLLKEIIKNFYKRNDLIPSLYDISKKYITKEKEVFNEILKLRRNYLSNYDTDDIFDILENEINIHKELNFIFKIINNNPKILKNENFLLIQDLFIEYSGQIGEKINIYKKVIINFNLLLLLKNLTLIGIFIKIDKKQSI